MQQPITARARASLVAVFAASALTIAACAEQVDSTVGCPLTCPQQTLPLRDTVFDAVILDTSIAAFPPIGFEPALLLANRPDTFETRVILRFDTLPSQAHQSGVLVDSVITHVDTAALVLTYLLADSARQPTIPYTIEVYDVTDVSDTSTAALLPLFSPERLVAFETFEPDSEFVQSRDVLLPTDLILQRILDREPLRLGLRIVADQSVEVRFSTGESGLGPYLSLDVFGDNFTPRTTVATQSRFPEDEPFYSEVLRDYMIYAKQPPPPDPDVLRVGGLPSSRAYIELDLPSSIIDSSIVVRATLILTQRLLLNAPLAGEPVTIFPVPLVGSPRFILDLARLLEFIGPPRAFGLDSVAVIPNQSGVREFEVGPLVRRWLGTDPANVPRVIVLRTGVDGFFPNMADFFSMEAPPGLRPRFRITYSPRTPFGLP